MSKLLIKYPSRSRPKEFLYALDKYVSLLSGKHEVEIIVSADADDKSMQTPDFLDKYRADGFGWVAKAYYGNSKSKIEACNADIEKAGDWDVVLLASDDMIPQVQGYDDIILTELLSRFPDTDGALFFPDGATHPEYNAPAKRNCCTISILGRKYYDRFGYMYHPDYRSYFCDNELTEAGQMLGKLPFIDRVIIKNEHPFWGGSFKHDDLYRTNDKDYKADQRVFERRSKANFDITIPEGTIPSPRPYAAPAVQPVLSILIPTIVGREDSFNRLYSELQRQAEPFGDQVEILYEKDDKKITIGEKRNILYDKANGKYSVQIDDDDMVCPHYVETVLRALKHAPTHVGYLTQCVMNGTNKISCDSDRYDGWFDRKDGYDYVRTIFYKDIIRTDIARSIPSKHINFGEDAQFSKDLKASGLLTKEVFINGIMYYYTYNAKRK